MPGLSTFRDRVAVVTGAGSGIGRALAEALDAAGARLALVDRDEEALAATAARLGARASCHVVDVADRAAMEALPGAVLEVHGAVHLLVNNAGVAATGPFFEQDPATYARLLDVNVLGVVHGCRFFAAALRDHRPAWIVNNASVLAHLGVAGRSAYCASKFAVRGYSEAVLQELEDTGIGLTVVYAGAVDTGIIRHATFEDERGRAGFATHFERTGLAPARVARAILAAVRRGRRRLFLGRDATFIYRLKRLAPVRADRWLNAIAERQLDQRDLHREATARFLRDAGQDARDADDTLNAAP